MSFIFYGSSNRSYNRIQLCIISLAFGLLTLVSFLFLADRNSAIAHGMSFSVERQQTMAEISDPNTPNPTPNITLTGEISGEAFGYTVSKAGDTNNDGYNEIVVGAPWYNENRGRVYVYPGESSGIAISPNILQTNSDTYQNFGLSIDSAGDINNDGFSDLIIGAPGRHYQGDWGYVYVYTGTVHGIRNTPAFTLTGEFAGDLFGYSVGSAGDINNDGYSDIVVGAPLYPTGDPQTPGRAYVFLGSENGVIPAPHFIADGKPDSNLGWSVGTAGDVNNDEISDIIIGEVGKTSTPFGIGHAYIYLGSNSGLADTASYTLTGEYPGDFFGYSVGTAGDVNYDGYDDIIVGASGYPNNTSYGRAYVYTSTLDGVSTVPELVITGESANSFLGSSVSSLGDINGDSNSDVIVGAYGYDDGVNGAYTGRVYVYLGAEHGIHSTPAFTITGGVGGYLGISVDTAGDVNNDGLSDMLIGATEWNNPGRAYIYYGSVTNPRAIDDSASTQEDVPVKINVINNDFDFDNNLDILSTEAITEPINGGIYNPHDGTFVYTPTLNYNGDDYFTYRVCDTDNQCDNATVSILITPIADNPEANDDQVQTEINTAIEFDVIENDNDPDGDLDPSSVSVISTQLNGTLINNFDGTFSYSPTIDYFGQGDFIYQICDLEHLCDNASVVITVTTNLDEIIFMPFVVR